MHEQWYYAHQGQRTGPVGLEELKAEIASGKVQPGDLVWKEGMANWAAASTMPELFASGAAAETKGGGGEEITGGGEEAAAGSAQAEAAKPAAARPSALSGDIKAQAAQVAKEASRDAVAAFKILLSNPVGGLRDAFDRLGKFRAMQVGVVFALVFYICEVVGGYMRFSQLYALLPSARQGQVSTVGHVFWLLFVAIVPILFVVAASALSRRLFRGSGSIDSDIFIAGAALLPFGVYCLAVGIIGPANPILHLVFQVLGTSFTVLMLYSGCTNVLKIPEAAATLATPLMFLPVAWGATKVLTAGL